jgi:triosephosphate isomerase
MREIIIAGNWKMNKDAASTFEFCQALAAGLHNLETAGIQVIVAPPYPFLELAQASLKDCAAKVSAQDVSAQTDGAFTGEVSATMLTSLGLPNCIIGHSERRQYHHESDSLIREKLLRLREAGISPILCIGETLEQREAGQTSDVVLSQLEGCLQDIDLSAGTPLSIAYEPVWAIGTGRTATSDQAQEVHAIIRAWLDRKYGTALAQNLSILYGGSVKPENIAELLSREDIDGALIGGASLKIADFLAMIRTAIDIVKN